MHTRVNLSPCSVLTSLFDTFPTITNHIMKKAYSILEGESVDPNEGRHFKIHFGYNLNLVILISGGEKNPHRCNVGLPTASRGQIWSGQMFSWLKFIALQ